MLTLTKHTKNCSSNSLDKSIWITWEHQRRNISLCHHLNIPLFELAWLQKIDNKILKYYNGLLLTWKELCRRAPRLIISQNPSIILALFVTIYCLLTKRKSVIDAHNAGLFPKEGKNWLLNRVSKFIQRFSHLTIVTNEALKHVVQHNGGIGYVLPDPIPNLSNQPKLELHSSFNILFICSYAKDEPYMNVLVAAHSLDDTFHIYVTGDYRKAKLDPRQVPPNVTLMGYISEDSYLAMLQSVDATIDLTERENCLVCGAYESVAAGRPMVLSGSEAIQRYFSKGAIFTDNTVAGLVAAIKGVHQEYSRLLDEVRDLKATKQSQWAIAGDELKKIIERMLVE